ncbi:uncharacterized protein [Aristolochia californica]|uniref:uncharacterized protein n=1 Tax=Aristolochia californica TaxID=171875 RepID=UPI0035DAF244
MSLDKFGQEKQSATQGEEEQHQMSIPVLARLDRLDRLLLYFEETRNLSARRSVDFLSIKAGLEKQSKPLSWVLEEVQFKGTLMERIAILESRVLQLSLDMEEGSTTSSSTLLTSDNTLSTFLKKDDTRTAPVSGKEHKQDKIEGKVFKEAQTSTIHGCMKVRKQKAVLTKRGYRKWFGWLQMRC